MVASELVCPTEAIESDELELTWLTLVTSDEVVQVESTEQVNVKTVNELTSSWITILTACTMSVETYNTLSTNAEYWSEVLTYDDSSCRVESLERTKLLVASVSVLVSSLSLSTCSETNIDVVECLRSCNSSLLSVS